jgi:hypothetical protein
MKSILKNSDYITKLIINELQWIIITYLLFVKMQHSPIEEQIKIALVNSLSMNEELRN